MMRHGFLRSPLLVILASLAAVAVLVVLLQRRPVAQSQTTDELVLYCATGVIGPVEEIRQAYEKEFGVRILIDSGGSGKLLNTMRIVQDRGDLFLSADESYVIKAREEGMAAEWIPVALQRAMIGVQKGNPKNIRTAADLLRDDVKVSIANPELTAIGKLALQKLDRSGQWAALKQQMEKFPNKVSMTGTVNEAAQNVKVGAADAAFVWDATARQFNLDMIDVSEFKDAVEKVTVAVLKRTKSPQRALHFARFLTARDRGGVIFEKYNYSKIPDADFWADRPRVDIMCGAMLRPAVEEVIKNFELREGVEIDRVYNGCGILVGEIKAGKRPAAYFACDIAFMDSVAEHFEKSRVISQNDMVVLVKKNNPQNIKSLSDFTRKGLRIGLAHPEKSALGALTKAMLEREKLHQPLVDSGNWILGSATGDYLVNQLRAGPLDAVIVYRSNALASSETLKDLDLIEINAPNEKAAQPFAVSKDGRHKHLMQRLQRAILAPESLKHFTEVGFQIDPSLNAKEASAKP